MSDEGKVVDNPKSATGKSYVFGPEDRAKAVEARRRKAAEKALTLEDRYFALREMGREPIECADEVGLPRDHLRKLQDTDLAWRGREEEADEVGSEAVIRALRAQAESGNMPAIDRWISSRAKRRWEKPLNPSVVVDNRSLTINGEMADSMPRLERVAKLLEVLQERQRQSLLTSEEREAERELAARSYFDIEQKALSAGDVIDI